MLNAACHKAKKLMSVVLVQSKHTLRLVQSNGELFCFRKVWPMEEYLWGFNPRITQ